MVNLMYHRNHLKKCAIKSSNVDVWAAYRQVRNKITNMLKSAKRAYYCNAIHVNKSNPSKMWNVLNKLTGGKFRAPLPGNFSPNSLNDYFNSIGQSTVSELSVNSNNDLLWKSPPSIHKFEFQPVSTQAVAKHLYQLSRESSVDVLEFDSKLLYIARDIISPIITKFFNVSLSLSNVIDDWKLSRITPVYKGKGSKNDPTNYRPISVIGHIPKILEKEVQTQVMSYLNKFDFISPDQSAYITKHNTQTSIHKVLNDWSTSIDDGLLLGACAIDIKKCFDTINHSILLKKLDCYGFCEDVVNWFQSYISKRGHKVRCKNSNSCIKYVDIGVPQGSVLGPVLFLVYLNDINIHVEKGTVEPHN